MDNQVEEVKSKTDIVSVIGERIELKKAGRNYKALCPFHGEKTPSFMVSPELQIFKCFGCDAKGDVFGFLEQFEGMEFSEALRYLAEKAGVKLVRTGLGEVSEKEKLVDIHREALRFYNYLLLSHPLGKRALEYLEKDRGLKKSTIEEFQLGYSPDNPLLIQKFLVGKKKFAPQDLERAGIAVLRGSAIYDRFGGRVIFPLFDHRGNPIGFAGRVLPWYTRETGKYINSPETPVYHKSNVLYGLNITRGNIKKKKVAIIVEGELDLISSYQAGIKNIVAIKGSALTEEQVRLLSRFAPKFILALDSDFAGDAAARRGITVAENSGITVKIAKISKFKDPDEAARGDIESYKKDLIGAEGVWDFLINSVFSRFDAASGEGSAKISRELIPIIAQIEDKIVQSHYINLIAKKLGVEVNAVAEQVAKVVAPEKKSEPEDVSQSPIKDRRTLLEERLLGLAFQSDPSVLTSKEVKPLILTPLAKRIIEELEAWPKKKFIAAEFSKSLPGELTDGFAATILKSEWESTHPDEIKKELDLVIKELKILTAKQKLKELSLKIRQLEEAGELEALHKAQNKFTVLTQNLSKLNQGESVGVILEED